MMVRTAHMALRSNNLIPKDEKSIMNNLAKRYGEDNIFDNSDEEAITGSFCYEDGSIYLPKLGV